MKDSQFYIAYEKMKEDLLKRCRSKVKQWILTETFLGSFIIPLFLQHHGVRHPSFGTSQKKERRNFSKGITKRQPPRLAEK
ncbi:Hypothetical protein NTJ_13375 [Nesidiocoris tenuis]|uniref:Uncharacterized protein n=1 Tax=Nesidiocoris tenuis TaxID=355587 RepID=A0ABN7B846_9HEMI|nr:Hypothetical protein NTJ_13375 [Nesidiocoris tenuis]